MSTQKMIPQVTSDLLHRYLLKAVLFLALRNRFTVKGTWRGERIVCVSFDCDTGKDMERIPSLLDKLEDMSVPSSFALVGDLARSHPETVKEVARKRHEIVNHTFSHPESIHPLSSADLKKEIESFQDFMMNAFCVRPQGFRAPHLMRTYNRDLFDLLKESQLYDSSYVGRGVSIIDGSVEIPLTLCPDHSLVCFDYWHHFQLPFVKCSLGRFMSLWDDLLTKESFVNVYLDPHLVSDPFLEGVFKAVPDGFEFCRMADVAARVRKHGDLVGNS